MLTMAIPYSRTSYAVQSAITATAELLVCIIQLMDRLCMSSVIEGALIIIHKVT